MRGTLELLRLASRMRVKPLHFVSSFSVYLTPEYRGREVGEDDPVHRGVGGYRETKRVCERLIDQARERGLPVSLYRPPFISWHTRTGAFNDRDFLIRLMSGCLALGAAPELDLVFHLAPVDFVSRALVQLAGDPEALGGNYNLIPEPHGTAWTTLVACMIEAGAALELLPYGAWRERLGQAATSNPLHSFFPALSSDLPERGSAVFELFSRASVPTTVHAPAMRRKLGELAEVPEVGAGLVARFLERLAARKG